MVTLCAVAFWICTLSISPDVSRNISNRPAKAVRPYLDRFPEAVGLPRLKCFHLLLRKRCNLAATDKSFHGTPSGEDMFLKLLRVLSFTKSPIPPKIRVIPESDNLDRSFSSAAKAPLSSIVMKITKSLSVPFVDGVQSAQSAVIDFENAFEWACAFTNLSGDSKLKIKSEIWRLHIRNELPRVARKTLAPLLPSDLVWRDAGPYLLNVPTIAELIEDDDLSRKDAKLEQQRLKDTAAAGLVMENNSAAEVAQTFFQFVAMKMYAIGHWRDFEENAKHRPYLIWDAVVDSMTPKDCIRKDGKVYRIDDPFWSENPIPCGKAFCRCAIRSLSAEDAKSKRQKK